MHIDREPKLDFADVLIRPKRSALPSRAEVDIVREFRFKHSQHRYRGIPIIAANMDTVTRAPMAIVDVPESGKLKPSMHHLWFTDQGQTGLHDPTGRLYRFDRRRLDAVLQVRPDGDRDGRLRGRGAVAGLAGLDDGPRRALFGSCVRERGAPSRRACATGSGSAPRSRPPRAST